MLSPVICNDLSKILEIKSFNNIPTKSLYHNTNNPQEANKQHVKGDKEAEEPPHRRHTPFVRIAVYKVIGQHVDRGRFRGTTWNGEINYYCLTGTGGNNKNNNKCDSYSR